MDLVNLPQQKFGLVEQNEAAHGNITFIDSVEHATSVPVNMADAIEFRNRNEVSTEIFGTITVSPAIEEYDISRYVIYWGGNNAEKLPLGAKIYLFSGNQLTLDHNEITNIQITSLDGKTIYIQGKDYTVENELVTTQNAAIEDTPVRVTYDLKPVAVLEKGSSLQHEIPTVIKVPAGATHFLVFTQNEFGEMFYGISTKI